MIVAGEASGDLHGGDLAREILARDPACELFGIAGAQMRAAGVRADVRIEDIHGLGLTELISTIGLSLSSMRRLRHTMRSDPPDLLILIDYAEFNLMLAGFAKRAGVPVLYYITPQVWAWRRGRVKKIADRSSRLAVVLPFEKELYGLAGDRVTFVGHPLLDRVSARAGTRRDFRSGTACLRNANFSRCCPEAAAPRCAIILPPLVDAARILARDHGLQPVIALAPTLTPEQLAGHSNGQFGWDSCNRRRYL